MNFIKASLFGLFLFGGVVTASEYYVCYQNSSVVPMTDKEVFISYEGCSISKTDCNCIGQRQYGEYKRECDALLGLKQCRKLQKKF